MIFAVLATTSASSSRRVSLAKSSGCLSLRHRSRIAARSPSLMTPSTRNGSNFVSAATVRSEPDSTDRRTFAKRSVGRFEPEQF